MRKVTVTCDYCGRELSEGAEARHPKVEVWLDDRPTACGHMHGTWRVFGERDLCVDCQERLYQEVLTAVRRFIRLSPVMPKEDADGDAEEAEDGK